MKKTIVLLLFSLLSFGYLYANNNIISADGAVNSQWGNANVLFRKNPHWRGADDAYSIKLGPDKSLWLFGDTLISRENKFVKREPANIRMIRNSIGLQWGTNPESAAMNFYWGNNNDAYNPGTFFVSPYVPKENWLWPGDAVLLPDNKTVVIFFMNIKPAENEFHFDIAGYQVAIIRNSDAPPQKWLIEWVENVSSYEPLKILTGSGGVIVEGDYLYAYGYGAADLNQYVFLTRWELALFTRTENPNLSNPEWWCGNEYRWHKNSEINSKIKPMPLWNKGQTEFTVTKMYKDNPEKTFYLMTEAYPQNGFVGNADLKIRTSKKLTGPWSEATTVYKKLCRDNPVPEDIMVYAGKCHPELTGADIIFTYATNTMKLETLWDWEMIYYPRFLRFDGSLLEDIANF